MRITSIAPAILFASVVMIESSAAQKSVSIQPHLATLQQQKMCAEQSDKKFGEFDEYKSSQGQADVLEDIEHTSHFEVDPGVCYLTAYRFRMRKTKDTNDTTGVLWQQDEVFNAFEGRRYARFVYIGQGKKYDETEPVDCRVKPHGHPEIKCRSWAEYQELLEKHFGIGR